MLFRIGCTLGYVVPEPSVFLFNIAVAQGPRQRIVHEELKLTPALTHEEQALPETNTRFTRIDVPAGHLSLHYEARVERAQEPPLPDDATAPAMGQLPAVVLPYLFPSRYCQADLLTDLAYEVAGHLPPGPAQVTAICDWVYDNLRYESGASNSSTSAVETLRDRAGVCRDFAHLAITLCRAMGIPARFVTGYAWGLGFPDFHACMEAFLIGQWHLFDPTRKVATKRIIRIGTGRDAADASFVTIFGDGRPSELTEMMVFAEPAPDATPEASAQGFA
ncbi:MAG: transglutaminase-like putative cysteine protease [Alphaproteobacteria bacterium]|jgi:transglutaminase-like putative cysteine protease